MAGQPPSLDLTASFTDVSSPTPFGVYDADTAFQSDADGMVEYTDGKLGGSILNVELSNKDIYASFEEAALEYSAIVNSYQAKSMLADLVGTPTGSLESKQQKFARMNLALAKRKGDAYSSEAGVGGTKHLFSSSIDLKDGEQVYDLKNILSGSGELLNTERAEIREIFHFSPTAAYRFFDTTSAINYLNNEFSFESFTPETIFYLLPIWEDVLRAQQLEQSHKIRRSNYSYSLVDNVLRIYPTPTSDVKLHFTYYKVGANDDPFDASQDPLVNGVSNLSNVPFGNIQYSQINSVGRQWIRRFAVSLAKERLGQVRSKISSIPIPNGEAILNGPALVSEAREEQMQLRDEVKALFDTLTYQALAEEEARQAENLQQTLARVPLGIFMGSFLLFLSPLGEIFIIKN